MKRHTKAFDIVIQGDELEQHRIQLEHNLQNTELMHRLPVVSDDEYNDNESIEYPRHNSGPGAFPSFEIPSREVDHFDGETHSQIHPWSYRTVDDDDEGGINPFEGGTVSTAAHHASALTLSAGLGGGRTGRRNVSLSGAEYDPDRPLHNMITGVGNQISIFDVEPSRSKYSGVGSVTFDPLVVDSTAELDRVLKSGYAPVAAQHIQSPLHSSSSSSASDSESNPGHRPKLSDALRRVSFSPKRPRSNAGSPLVNTRQLADISENMPTPKPQKRASLNLSSPARPSHPQVRLQPPTPSSSSSNFSKMAKGITREIEHAKRGEGSKPASAFRDRNSSDRVNGGFVKQQNQAPISAMKQRTPTSRSKVYLPDVTGLTSAVESPAKIGTDYYAYRADASPRENEARLISVLNTVQSKLQQLEEENSISRRRVRELEMELEICKRDVVRERTRVMEREEIIVQQQHRDMSIGGSARRNKGKARARDVTQEQDDLHWRYKEVVEEKKALESLITTLRAHLSRLTAELSSHRQLLTELRELRTSDSRALKQKGAEIEQLKEEVERLAGEVEVLRGVVEEGLKERRNERETTSVRQLEADTGMSRDDEHEEAMGTAAPQTGVDEQNLNGRDVHESSDDDDDDEEPEPFDPVSILGSSANENARFAADKTMRTDHATLGSSLLAQSHPTNTSGQLFDSAVLEPVSGELEDHERNDDNPIRDEELREQNSVEGRQGRRGQRPTVDDDDDDESEEDEEDSRRRGSPVPRAQQQQQRRAAVSSGAHALPPSRPRAPTPDQHQQRQRQPRRSPGPVDDTPFPQIRGTHLERLFFSAPEHNARTCTVCNRQRRAGDGEGGVEPSWIPKRFRGREGVVCDGGHDSDNHNEDDENDDDDDEGFAEGSEQQDHVRRDRKGKQRIEGERVTFSKDPGPWRSQARREGLPPQTVVARVIRELEDDFTHYKSIYVELADQYKDMDAVSDVPRRNILAKHLREVVDILEQKGDQIASLYDLLSFKDKHVAESVVPNRRSSKMRTASSTAIASSSIGRNGGGIRQG